MKIPTIRPWRPGQTRTDDQAQPGATAEANAKPVPPAAPAALPVDTAPIDTLLDAEKPKTERPTETRPSTFAQPQPQAEPAINLSAPPPVLAGPLAPASLSTRAALPPPLPEASLATVADTAAPETPDAASARPSLMARAQQLKNRLPSRAEAQAAFERAKNNLPQLSLPRRADQPPSAIDAGAQGLSAAPAMDQPAPNRGGRLQVPRVRMPALPPAVWSVIRVLKRVLWRPRAGRVRLGWLTWVIALLGAVLVHIAATFGVPSIANGDNAIARRFFPLQLLGSQSAYATLKRDLPVNRMVVLPAPQANARLLPFLAPDMRYAMCRYDISAGPLQITAVLPELGWSLAIHTPDGANPYVVPAPPNRPLEVSFLLVPTTDRLFNLTPGQRRLNTDATQVSVAAREGLIIIRAPITGVAYDGAARAALEKAICTPTGR
ncbi:MAG: hypothetical protein RL291_1668 [Pseudomonadota bacterium]